jgi:hypothetical protein
VAVPTPKTQEPAAAATPSSPAPPRTAWTADEPSPTRVHAAPPAPAPPPAAAPTPAAPPTVERRSAALLLQLEELRDWLGRASGEQLPAGADMLVVLEDGTRLAALADAAAPGTSSPFIRATAAERVASFVAASVALGVPEEEALQPHHVLAGPNRSAAAVLRAMRAFAAVAHARGVGPAWDA